MATKRRLTAVKAWRVTEAYWIDTHDQSAREITLTVDHGNGTITYVAVPIRGMTQRIRKPTPQPRSRRKA